MNPNQLYEQTYNTVVAVAAIIGGVAGFVTMWITTASLISKHRIKVVEARERARQHGEDDIKAFQNCCNQFKDELGELHRKSQEIARQNNEMKDENWRFRDEMRKQNEIILRNGIESLKQTLDTFVNLKTPNGN